MRLAWLQDVQRVAERIQRIPGYGYRGDGGVASLGALWSLRERYGSMGEEWLPSVRAWCAWWSDPRHRGRILSLDRWLARERYEEVPVPELVPLPDPPPEMSDIPDAGQGRGETELSPWQQQVRQWESEGLPVSVVQALEEQEPVDGQIRCLTRCSGDHRETGHGRPMPVIPVQARSEADEKRTFGSLQLSTASLRAIVSNRWLTFA